MPDGGKIFIHMKTNRINEVIIDLVDEGIGIPEERIKKVRRTIL